MPSFDNEIWEIKVTPQSSLNTDEKHIQELFAPV